MAQGLQPRARTAAVARLLRQRADDPAAGDLRHDAAVEDADVDAAAVADRHVPAVHRDRRRGARTRTRSWTHYGGVDGVGFSFIALGAGAGIALSLIAQIGEQVDYLRFMPAKTKENARGWWAAVIAAGPGWVILGALKQLGGAFLAFYVIGEVGSSKAVAAGRAVPGRLRRVPAVQHRAGRSPCCFVVLSQVKINVTNAYSGSLRWTNFFSHRVQVVPGPRLLRLLQRRHRARADGGEHVQLPQRAARLLLQRRDRLDRRGRRRPGDQQAAAEDQPVLHRVQARAPARRSTRSASARWRVASIVSIIAYFGAFGEFLDAWSPFLAITIAMVLSPVLSLLLGQKYYLAREPTSRPPSARPSRSSAASARSTTRCRT